MKRFFTRFFTKCKQTLFPSTEDTVRERVKHLVYIEKRAMNDDTVTYFVKEYDRVLDGYLRKDVTFVDFNEARTYCDSIRESHVRDIMNLVKNEIRKEEIVY